MPSTQQGELKIIDYIPQLELGLKIECDPRNYIDRFILSKGFWEPLVVSALGALIRPGDVCVDVGANAGYISVVMSRLTGSSGRVLSFEPNSDVIPKFVRNLSLNPDLESIIQLIPMGLGKEPTRMFLAPDTGAGIGNASLALVASSTTTHSVAVIRLDSLNLSRVDCMKVDVEGMELDVLKGAEQTISRFLPHIIFETLTTSPAEQHKPIEEYLRKLGYKVFCFNPSRGQFQDIGYPTYPQDDSYAIHPSRKHVAAPVVLFRDG